MSAARMEEVVDRTAELIAEARRRMQELEDRVDQALSAVPAPLQHLIDPIRRQLQQLRGVIRQAWETQADLLARLGCPWRVDEVGRRWSVDVADRLTAIADGIGQTRLRTDNHWTGTAAAAYLENLAAQGSQLTDLRNAAVKFRDSMESTADAIWAFWLAMGFALLELIVVLCAAIATAASVVGIPAALAAAIGVIGNFVVFAGAALMAVKVLMDTIENGQYNIGQEIRNMGASWPVPRFTDITGRGPAGWQPLP